MSRLFLAFAAVVALGFGASWADGANKPPERRLRPIEEIYLEKDANQDSQISKDEFMKDTPEERWNARERSFDHMDADHDGFITPEEMRAYMEMRFERLEKANRNETAKPPHSWWYGDSQRPAGE